MKTRASFLSVCAVAMGLAAAGNAADPLFVGGVGSTIVQSRPEVRGELRAWWLKDELNLTTEQTDRIAILFINENVELDALGYVPSRGAVTAVRQRWQAQVRDLLTPDQRGKFNLLAQSYGGGRVGKSPWDLLERLDRLVHLTPTQKTAALDILIRGTEFVAESDGPDQAAMVRKIHQATKEEIRGLLTADQLKLWQAAPRKSRTKASVAVN
jgi:Spy/CpxP family protein refolding chaperone